ncbi:hypothetical protein COCMIDRAFT_85450 [Bipolaris oryzae ATCC 44560]|uniref:Uncharacterized protein n=1 Tax=Bipolaris oryzae ATCC 44560 TaxID=930090 RepID=W6ZNL2_COCMI|nr:uncharacterized protein COCMIDRAFT_85450 [Bipolaris oryzae ATCC 44560]EUC49119.1 hypothetical protein COCMIDRAFT_85450 [Bipolaris oryzae ATCC 44560]
MTPIHRLNNPGPLHCSNHRQPACGAKTARYDSHAAAMDAWHGGNANPHAFSPHALRQESLTHQKALVDRGSSRLQASSQPGFAPDRNGCTRHYTSGVDDVQDCSRQQQYARGRAVPINLASRLANRSNGVPLATIVEQGSCSTLNSKSSLLSVCPFASLRAVENTSPNYYALPQAPLALDGRALQLNVENGQPELVLDPTTRESSKPSYKDIGSLSPQDKTTTPSLQTILDRPRALQHQIGEIGYDGNSKNVKDLVDGVIHNVQAVSRARSRSSSAHTPIADHHHSRQETSDDTPNSHLCGPDRFKSENKVLVAPAGVSSAPLGMTQLPAHQHQSRDGWTLNTAFKPSARLYLLSKEDMLSSHTQLGAAHPLSKPSTGKEGRHDNASKISAQRRSFNLEGNAFYGISMSSNATHSWIEVDGAEDASQNASFCSTVSTSYSGSVVGVDVDLQHEFPQKICHSSSSTHVAPVWFTPQVAEQERHASLSRSPEAKQSPETERTRRSITSSALTTLLPIAAASGIVRRNYETPKISFFSPSGHLIQPEGSSSPGTPSASDFSGSPTVSAFTSINPTPASYSVFPATCLPPPRPSLRPMTTPPTSSVPLPANLRHHHNYRRPEKSQINPEIEYRHSFNNAGLAVKGCDGIVRTGTLPVNTQTHQSYGMTKPRHEYRRDRSVRLFKDDARLKARSRRARLMTVMSTTTAKGRNLGKQDEVTIYASMPHKRKRISVATSDRKRLPSRHVRREGKTGLVGPVAGHVLRICFCQPYDGASKPTHDVATKTFCIKSHASEMHGNSKKETLPIAATETHIVDAVLPNARVVTGVNRTINTDHRIGMRTSSRRKYGNLTIKSHLPCQTAV